ncbi:unnamed protein product [Schistocephalus solidus]|uniref:FERM domain-containing protein n=1 Tax=Schistocephalus solidus TaxID=70667 RepID=A0A183S921_SCHSO|nr:unnamed protein product [Schistocephalus solidus]
MIEDEFKCLIVLYALQIPRDAEIKNHLLRKIEQDPDSSLQKYIVGFQWLKNLRHDYDIVKQPISSLATPCVYAVTHTKSTFARNATSEVTRNITARQAKTSEFRVCNRKTSRPKGPLSHFGPKPRSSLATLKTEFEAQRNYLTVIINGKPVRLQFDTASDIAVISKRTWHMIGRHLMITSNKKTLDVSGGILRLTTLPTLDNLDTFLRICNPDDSLQVLLMIEAGSDGFASLVMDYAVSKVASQ